jgi:hypothetical protein
MKAKKGMIYKIRFSTKDGQEHELETDGHIGKYCKKFIPYFCNEILKSELDEIKERWQEPITE